MTRFLSLDGSCESNQRRTIYGPIRLVLISAAAGGGGLYRDVNENPILLASTS